MTGLTLAAVICSGTIPAAHARLAESKLSLSPVLSTIPASLGGDRNLELGYDVYAGGFHALNASLEFGLGAASYAIELEASTQGFIGDVFPWKAHFETSGWTDGKRLTPARHTAESSWRDAAKTVEMDYDQNGALTSRKEIRAGGKTFDTSPPAQISKNAVDLLTGTLKLLRSVNMKDSCEGQVTIFDGKRRFNLVFTDDGTETIASNQYSKFQGEARRCTIEVEPVAGFSKKDEKRGWLAVQEHTKEHDKLPTVWLAPLYKNGPIVPVRMEIASDYGSVVAHLSTTEVK